MVYIGLLRWCLVVKNPPANAGDTRDVSSIPESKRFSGIGNANSFQYSCLENSMDRGTWQATVYGAAKRQTLTQQQHIPIGHFLNCLGFVFVCLFSSLPLSFSCGLMTIFSAVLRMFFLFS